MEDRRVSYSLTRARTAAKIGAFRKRRTRFATSCLICVFIISLMALQVWVMYPLWLNVVLLGAIIVFFGVRLTATWLTAGGKEKSHACAGI